MKTFSAKCDRAGFADALAKARELAPQLTLVFAPSDYLTDKERLDKAFATGAVNVLGCSAAEQISPDGVSRDSCSILAIRFDATEVKVADGAVPALQARGAGQEFGRKLAAPNLAHVFLLLPSANAGAAEFVRGVAETVAPNTVITGGVAGDGGNTMINGRVHADRAVAFALYGDKISVACGVAAGWKSFGPIRRVTKAEGNILLELDGKPAAAVYAQYLRDTSGVPLYPLSLLRDDGRTDTGLMRSVAALDEGTGALTLDGDMPQNSFVRLMHADSDSLAVAGENVSDVSLVVSGALRRMVAGSDADAELTAVTGASGNSALAGFYGQGEIGPVNGKAELNNATLTLTTITEKA